MKKHSILKLLLLLCLVCLASAFVACATNQQTSTPSQEESTEYSSEESSSEESSSVIEITEEAKSKIFILERTAGEAEALENMISSEIFVEAEYTATAVCLEEIELIPNTIEEMVAYGQYVLVNIAYADMPIFSDGVRFEELLQEYVRDYGGGMFTIGGNKEDYENLDENGNPVKETITETFNYVFSIIFL